MNAGSCSPHPWGRSLLAVALAVALAAAGGRSLASDPPALILQHLTPGDGLPQQTVFATLQDSQGFIWLGTEDGLIRYDGSELVRYAYRRDSPGGLPGNYIYQIAEDSHHDLWIAIKDGGLARWNRAHNDFTVYRHDPHNPHSLVSDAVRAVLVDASDRVWVGTSDAGLDLLDPGSGQIEHLRHEANDPSTLSDNQVFTLALDHSGSLWVGTAAGLDRWEVDRHAFTHWHQGAAHNSGNAASLSGSQVLRVLEDRGGTFWVATFDGGLDELDARGHLLRVFRHDTHRDSTISSDDVRALLEDHAGHLWVGTADGLDLLDRTSGRFTHYRHDERNPESLRDSFVLSLYEDATGLVWIGTRAGGVSRWNPRSWEFGARRPGWLDSRLVTAFSDAPNNQVWIALEGGGLYQFDADSGKATSLDELLHRHDALGAGRLMALHEDRHGTLWIGTMASGLMTLSASRHLESIPVKPGDAHSLSAAGVMTIFEAHDGRIWTGLYGGGVNVIDPSTRLVRQLPFGTAPGAVSAPNVRAIAEGADGNFWIGTDGGGLDLARADGRVIRVYRHDPHDLSTLPSNIVYAVTIDARGRVWVATDGGGLAQVTGSASAPDAIGFKVVSRDDGLSSDTLYSVLPDARGRLWLSGNSGLIRFDPDTRTIKTFHREDGLQGEEFDSGAYARLSDGRLCFGGAGGFNIFDPAFVSEWHQPPRIALTQVEVLGAPAPQPIPYWLLQRIDLDYRASIVSFDIGVLDFSSPRHNRIAYRVPGLTDHWIDLGTQHRITLTNLDPGDHLLEVRAANSDSVWSDPLLRMTIHRDPAPWKSSWAYCVYVLIALALIANALRLQRAKFRRIVREQQRLESEVALRTRELLDSNRQLAEAVQTKSRFLDRMSHELRTPMNGVLGMTELLARTELSPTQARLTHTIRTSGQVLLQIVNDLLDLSKVNAGKMALEELPLDLVSIVEECASLFDSVTEGVELITCLPSRIPRQLLGDPLRISQILINLISNAVKFTKSGEIVVRAEIEDYSAAPTHNDTAECARLVLTVRDTGIGMGAGTIGKVFEPFTQADESITRRYGGSGLGLAICRELAELMGGTITAESQLHVGSSFRVSLPLKLQLASDQRPTLPSLPPRRTQILARRPSVLTALTAHAEALGLSVTSNDGRAVAISLYPEDVIIVDADSHGERLESLEQQVSAIGATLMVISSAAEAERSGVAQRLRAGALVLKPLRRAALYESLRQALGLPLQPATCAASMAEQPARAGHVLLVEDEPVNAGVARGYLTVLGCSCVWVTSGGEALARYGSEHFDLILMDLSMPGIDGFETARLMRQRDGDGRRVPIIALSAHDALHHRSASLEAGMDDMLQKPYTLEQCRRLLWRWLMPEAQASSSTTSPPALDLSAEPKEPNPLSGIDALTVAHLRALRAGQGSDLYSELLELFRSSSWEAMTQLRASLSQENLPAIASGCHKLAAAAANVGALRFAQEVRRLEQYCRAGSWLQIRSLHERLQAAYPDLLDELLRVRKRAIA